MSARALEFVETWVSEKIGAIDFSAAGATSPNNPAAAKALAVQCVTDAQAQGIPESEINEAFDDLAAFIAGEIDEAQDRGEDRSDEEDAVTFVEGDDARLVDEDEDQAEKDVKGA